MKSVRGCPNSRGVAERSHIGQESHVSVCVPWTLLNPARVCAGGMKHIRSLEGAGVAELWKATLCSSNASGSVLFLNRSPLFLLLSICLSPILCSNYRYIPAVLGCAHLTPLPQAAIQLSESESAIFSVIPDQLISPASMTSWLWCHFSLLFLWLKGKKDSQNLTLQMGTASCHCCLVANEKLESLKVTGNGTLLHGQLRVSLPVPWKTQFYSGTSNSGRYGGCKCGSCSPSYRKIAIDQTKEKAGAKRICW